MTHFKFRFSQADLESTSEERRRMHLEITELEEHGEISREEAARSREWVRALAWAATSYQDYLRRKGI